MLLGRFEPLYPEFLDSKSRNPQFVDLPSVQLGSTEGKMADRQLTYRQYSKRHGSECHRSKRQGSQTHCTNSYSLRCSFSTRSGGHRFPRQAYPTVFALTHRSFRSYTPRVYRQNSPYRRIAVNLGDISNSTAPARGKVCLPSQFETLCSI
jgi:hypothetical protein